MITVSLRTEGLLRRLAAIAALLTKRRARRPSYRLDPARTHILPRRDAMRVRSRK